MSARASTESYLLLVMASAGYFAFTFSWFSLSATLVPVIEDVGLSSVEAGIVTGAVQLSYIPLSVLSGLTIDRVGSRRALSAGLLTIGIAHVFRGFSTGFPTLVVPTLLLGVGGTAVTFGLPKLVSELFPPDRAGSLSSVYAVGSTLGSATVFAITRPLITPILGGWRPFFVYTGGLVVCYAVLWFVVSGRLWGRVESFTPSEDRTFSVASMWRDLRSLLTHYGILLLVVVATMRLFISHSLSNWLPTILESRGFTPVFAATVTSLFILVRLFGIVAIPVLSDRYSTRRLPVVVAGVAGTLGSLGIVFGNDVWVLSVSLALVGTFVVGGLSPLLRAIPIEMDGVGPRLTAVANGFLFTVGQFGGFMGPVTIGFVRDRTGSFEPALALLAVACLVMMVSGYALSEPSR